VDAAEPDAGDAFAEQARYFVECVDSGAAPSRAPVEAAIEALRVALAARESARTGRRVELPG
jgi:predicted dehydrogenase